MFRQAQRETRWKGKSIQNGSGGTFSRFYAMFRMYIDLKKIQQVPTFKIHTFSNTNNRCEESRIQRMSCD